jgi:dTDP-4-dehydrorhamnose 3,5-epimerase
MDFIPTSLGGAYVIEPDIRSDNRGAFFRTYCKKEFINIGHTQEWVQMNHSVNNLKGTIRGLHYQVSPFSEIKLIRCTKGKIWDVIVDIRKFSPTFLKHFSVELSAENKKMIYIPEGFAHGFQTLVDDCEILYMHSAFYNPEAESGLRYDDPILNIQWKMDISELSERDKNHTLIDTNFTGI